jgi:transposase
LLSFSLLGKIFGLSGKKIYEWYRNVLSSFTDTAEQEALHAHDTEDRSLIDKVTKKFKKVLVPIFKPENFGKDMAVDDKNMGGEGYTIFSNKKTGKVALMAMTTKAGILMNMLQQIPLKIRMAVDKISKDLAEGYDWVARSMFMNALRIADKFHVICLALEALQDVRVRYRQEVLSEERKRSQKAQKEGKKYRASPQKKCSNGETIKEILARSRYLLFRFQRQWTEVQEQRAEILFELFPEIKKAYSVICSFRSFYNCKVGNVGKARKSLEKWHRKAKVSHIPEIQNFLSTVKKHEPDILAYFVDGHTNAFAESLNSKFQRFIQSNYGIRDRNFFHFRIKKHFS